MSLAISPIAMSPILPQSESPFSSPPAVSAPATPSAVLDNPESPVQNSHESPSHGSSAMRAAADYAAVVRHQVYHHSPGLTRNLPTYVIQGLAERAENPRSEHPLRDATIGIVADSLVEGVLARCIGATPAGYAILTANLVAGPLQESLPSWEEIGHNLGSREPGVSRAADRQMQARVVADILSLPAAAVHTISQLAREGFTRLSGSISESNSENGSPSPSSSSSQVSLPKANETISLGKLQEHTWEIIRLRIVREIVDGSSLVPPRLASVASSALPSVSSPSNLEESSDQLFERKVSREDKHLERKSSPEGKQLESSPIQWSGVQVHVPLDNIKDIRISTGVKCGQGGGYQASISSSLRHPVKDLHVSASVPVPEVPGVSVGVATSLRHPVRDAHVGVSSQGVGISTSLRHPAKDVQVVIPVPGIPFAAVSIPLKRPSQARIGVGVPLIPGASVSLPVRKLTKPPEKLVKNVARVLGFRKKRR